MFLICYWSRVNQWLLTQKKKKNFVPICNAWVTSKFLFSYDGEAEHESQSNIIIRVNHNKRINSMQNCEQPYWLQIAGGRISVIHRAWYYPILYPLLNGYFHVGPAITGVMCPISLRTWWCNKLCTTLKNKKKIFENPHLNI